MSRIAAMQMPAAPDQHRYYSALLFELGAPNNASAPLSMLERLSRNLLRRIAPHMLIVPEIRHVPAGSGGGTHADGTELEKLLASVGRRCRLRRGSQN
jgi:hypothetical protein